MAAELQSGADVAVSLEGVSKAFAQVQALERLNLAIRRGEFVALLGPSGCGKSTVLRLIAGLLEPTSGRVILSDGDIAAGAATASRGPTGVVFQEPPLMPWTTVAANVALPLSLRRVGSAEAAARVAAVLAQVRLAGFAQAYPRELSGGMKMRVSIARALVTEPPLLLMDEPFAALDEVTRFKLNDDLLALWRAAPRTVVFVTHSVFESVYLCERVVVLTPRPGRVFAELRIDAPLPRDRLFRTSADYAAQCRRVSEALADATAAGGRP
ncbi:MAG: ABC transporter ATP-binding protein [Hyphomicrobiales bacterium]|nr:ABC transporter ATP-binding protein [Hyphomicrobiales bacterium]